MAKTYRYFFQHTVFRRNIDGVIQDFFKNHYEVVAKHAADAHTQVPYNSILLVVKSMNNEILHDFRQPVDGSEPMRLREKLKEKGRTGLTPIEYEDAIHFGLIQ